MEIRRPRKNSLAATARAVAVKVGLMPPPPRPRQVQRPPQPPITDRTDRDAAVDGLADWAKANRRDAMEGISKDGADCLRTGLREMQHLSPHGWNEWWARNHMRYWRLPCREQRALMELAFSYTAHLQVEMRRRG